MLTTDREMWAYMRDQVRAVPEFALGGPSLAWLGAALVDSFTVIGQRYLFDDVPDRCSAVSLRDFFVRRVSG